MNDLCEPNETKSKSLTAKFETFADRTTKAAGSSWAFLTATLTVIIWATTGPIFNYSETWQLVINTGTTIVTFLMVFLIQKSQNKDSIAIQLKLNELIAANKGASNRLVNAESMTEEELRVLYEHYCTLAELAQNARDLKASHSVEEAIERAGEKGDSTEKGSEVKVVNGRTATKKANPVG
jgi:low affinity Fe/Cu permease